MSEGVAKLLKVASDHPSRWPSRVRKDAQASADAMITLASAEGEVSDIRSRTAERLARQEVRRQGNIENIVLHTAGLIQDRNIKASDPDPAEDWVAAFFEECKDVSDEDMRVLWARLLAGEIQTPGSFSLKSLATLRVISKHHAELFQVLANFLAQLGEKFMFPYVQNTTEEVLSREAGINYDQFLELEEFGLLHAGDIHVTATHQKPLELLWDGKRYKIEPNGHAPLASYDGLCVRPLTMVGTELYSLCSPTPNLEYFEILKRSIEQDGSRGATITELEPESR